jgi:hypothetical protein
MSHIDPRKCRASVPQKSRFPNAHPDWSRSNASQLYLHEYTFVLSATNQPSLNVFLTRSQFTCGVLYLPYVTCTIVSCQINIPIRWFGGSALGEGVILSGSNSAKHTAIVSFGFRRGLPACHVAGLDELPNHCRCKPVRRRVNGIMRHRN